MGKEQIYPIPEGRKYTYQATEGEFKFFMKLFNSKKSWREAIAKFQADEESKENFLIFNDWMDKYIDGYPGLGTALNDYLAGRRE